MLKRTNGEGPASDRPAFPFLRLGGKINFNFLKVPASAVAERERGRPGMASQGRAVQAGFHAFELHALLASAVAEGLVWKMQT